MYKERNETWERNHEAILNAYGELMKSNLEKGVYKRPSITSIAERAGVTRKIVYEHLEEIKIKDDVNLVHKAALSSVLETLAMKAVSGDVSAIKLYAQMIIDWSEKQIQDVNVKETPVIKIERVYRKDDETKTEQ